MSFPTVDLEAARQLLNFGARMDNAPRAEQQLTGAVAMHNILATHSVAYLADEVGMGKTYVALGVVALLRHFNPDSRVLIIAPRENIQMKWRDEMVKFFRDNVAFSDLRNRNLDGSPVREIATPARLVDLVASATRDPDQDFVARLTSYPLGMADTAEARRSRRDDLFQAAPDLPRWLVPLPRGQGEDAKREFKESFARAVCCALPVFDLVIVDEGHNLKHGFAGRVAARNRVLGLSLGRDETAATRSAYPGYGRRALHTLFLSATPVEETYDHLYNQMDVLGQAGEFAGLKGEQTPEAEKRKLVGTFLIRRLSQLDVAGRKLTKNQYRREWRRGGLVGPDEPMRLTDPRQQLAVALVQKKVSEVIGNERFGTAFQVGMLASFESFAETATSRRGQASPAPEAEDGQDGTFYGPPEDLRDDERQGVDVSVVDHLARSHRERFGRELPHPKVDAVVDRLAATWETGRKALIFVRRVRSVDELKRKLDERYDAWLIDRLRHELPSSVLPDLERQVAAYTRERIHGEEAPRDEDLREGAVDETEVDQGGRDTFFAWFFRGTGPRGVISGATLQGRFNQAGTTLATFFEDNHVMAVLESRSGSVGRDLAGVLGCSEAELATRLQVRAGEYVGKAKRIQRGERFTAYQAAALDLLRHQPGPHKDVAETIWFKLYEPSRHSVPRRDVPELGDSLETNTFFTELRRRPGLRSTLWPSPEGTVHAQVAEATKRARLLATTARLGHAFIDFYILFVNATGTLRQGPKGATDEGSAGALIAGYLSLLEQQQATPVSERGFRAFDELAAVATNHRLLMELNALDATSEAYDLPSLPKYLADRFGQQQPVTGMSGGVSRKAVQQFRMPGYPFVLVATDVLQEGEDLHTFCADVYHYGIAWTTSASEQRIGRVDRVNSLTERRLTAPGATNVPEDRLQVYYPHLEDTVEVLQVRRVLRRMDHSLKLLHEGLGQEEPEDRRLDVARELLSALPPVPQMATPLRTAFDVPAWALRGRNTTTAVSDQAATEALEAFAAGCDALARQGVSWHAPSQPRQALGERSLDGGRIQPFRLDLESFHGRPIVRCTSPVGIVDLDDLDGILAVVCGVQGLKIGAVPLGIDGPRYNLTVEGEALFSPSAAAFVMATVVDWVTGHADRAELELLPDRDRRLVEFLPHLQDEP